MLKKINLSLVNTVYICMMIVYMTVREILPLNFLIDSVAVSAVIFAMGFVLILLDLLTKKKCIEGIMQDILIAFLLVCCISSVINTEYGGIFGNLKFIAALGIEYLIFFSFSRKMSREKITKLLNPISITLIIVWLIPVLISILTYFFGIDIVVSGRGTWGTANQGFSFKYLRLWGIFQDPNYAGATSIIAIFAALRLIFTNKNIVHRILLGVSIFVQVMYIVLGGSRAALLLFFGSCVIYFVYRFAYECRKDIKSIGFAVGKCALSLAVAVILVFGIKYGLPYVKAIAFPENSAVSVTFASLYEKLYDISGYEYTLNAPKKDIQKEEPSTDEEDTTSDETTTEPGETDKQDEEKLPVVTPLDRTDLANDKDVSNGRFTRWKHTIEIFLNAPFFGTSPRNLTQFAKVHNSKTLIAKYGIAPHNGYLDVLVETGIMGFSVLGAAVLLALVVIFRKFFGKNGFSEDRGFLLVGILCLCGIAVFISDVFMMFSINSLLFWVLAGFAYNNACEHKDKGLIGTAYEKTIGKLISRITSGK